MNSKDIIFFAETNFRNKRDKFGIRQADRRQHTYVIGKTGVGKTALLKNMALQDIENGRGVAIIDPHGEFVEEVLDQVPANRIKDVVYFNPADTEYPISFNILEVPDLKYKHLVASGLLGIFTKIWSNVWSARMEYILDNCILALLDSPNATLLGILRLLIDDTYRQKIINNIKDPVVKSFWLNEYPNWDAKYRNEAIAPIQNKVGQFLNVSLVRNIVGQPKSAINISEIMDNQKIFLVNVSKGKVGEDNSSLLGAMLITKIQLAAMERVRIKEEERKDFYLYVDEFQNFVTESFANILSEARKYRLNLIVAHQYIGQLITESTEAVRDAVFGNVGTLIVFRVGATDAEFLEKEFAPKFNVQDLVNLPNYNIYLKLMVNGITSQPFSAITLPPITIGEGKSNREEIIKSSREKYSNPRKIVEEKIARWSEGLDAIDADIAPRPSGLYDVKCSLCNKKTQVIFKPEKNRSVYCESCLKRIKKEKNLPSSAKIKDLENFAELEKLGIEYGPSISKKPSIFAKITEKRKVEKQEKRESEIEEKIKHLSLEELILKEPTSFKYKKEEEEKQNKKEKDEINKEKLKQILEESLKDKKKQDKDEDDEKEKQNVKQGEIKPGETIEF